MKTNKSINLSIEVNGKIVYATPTGLKLGSKGTVQHTGQFLGQHSKGEARQIRKALRKAGETNKAAATRVTL